MGEGKKIKTALISVYHKQGLEPVVTELIKNDVTILSTGGTAAYLKELGATVKEVADLTAYPSILGGRVKTLHPKVFGGILARRDNTDDEAQLKEFEIPAIDLVIVDLYPFEETVASGAEEAAIIEKIDIGGIALIRAAAKNFRDVLIVPSQEQYEVCGEMLRDQDGTVSIEQRKLFAGIAFDVSSHYDTQIHNYLHPSPTSLKLSIREAAPLRYGENPHQQGWIYGDLTRSFTQLNGKPLSYNNLVDIDSGLMLIDEFTNEIAFAILKHTNPCGLATGKTVLDAWNRALECDPVSAFGGILVTNQKVDLKTAEAMHELFFEVLIAPDFDSDALELLSKKKKRILLKRKVSDLQNVLIKSSCNGVIVQERDQQLADASALEYKTSRTATETELQDIIFGNKAVKHLKSNAIAIVKNGQLIGSGIGQTSRVDALKHAVHKAQDKGFEVKGSILASDAFFPFADCAEIAHANGIEVITEPGGSIRDQDTIDYCEQNNMCLAFTSLRHFKH